MSTGRWLPAWRVEAQQGPRRGRAMSAGAGTHETAPWKQTVFWRIRGARRQGAVVRRVRDSRGRVRGEPARHHVQLLQPWLTTPGSCPNADGRRFECTDGGGTRAPWDARARRSPPSPAPGARCQGYRRGIAGPTSSPTDLLAGCGERPRPVCLSSE